MCASVRERGREEEEGGGRQREEGRKWMVATGISGTYKKKKRNLVYLQYTYVYVYACVQAQSFPTLCDPMACSPPGSSVHGAFRSEYWSGLPFSSSGDLPDPGIEPESSALIGRWFLYC